MHSSTRSRKKEHSMPAPVDGGETEAAMDKSTRPLSERPQDQGVGHHNIQAAPRQWHQQRGLAPQPTRRSLARRRGKEHELTRRPWPATLFVGRDPMGLVPGREHGGAAVCHLHQRVAVEPAPTVPPPSLGLKNYEDVLGDPTFPGILPSKTSIYLRVGFTVPLTMAIASLPPGRRCEPEDPGAERSSAPRSPSPPSQSSALITFIGSSSSPHLA